MIGTNKSSGSLPGNESPDAAVVREHAQKIAGSRGFSGSDPIRNLFLFLTERAIEQPGTPAKEYELATQCLGREDSFDPRSDSMVRVVASRLRSKLAEYYVNEGAEDQIRFDLPKGSYVLSIRERPGTPGPATEPASAVARVRPRVWIGAAGLLLVAAAGGFLGGRASKSPHISPPSRTFWRTVLTGERDPLIVYSNPRFEGSPSTGLTLVGEANRPAGPVIDVFTGTGELTAVHLLTRQIQAFDRLPRIKRAQLFTWDEALDGSLIFVGGYAQNSAVKDLPRLQKFNLKSDADEPFASHSGVINEAPIAGEQPYYLGSRDLNNGIAYAIVAIIPGASPSSRVLIVEGTTTYGTEAAAKFVCQPESINELLRRLRVEAGDPVPPFEALLEVAVRRGAPLDPRLIIVHRRGAAAHK